MREVERVFAAVKGFSDVHELEAPQLAHWGGGFSFRDPEGKVWDIAWAEGSSFDDKGGIIFL